MARPDQPVGPDHQCCRNGEHPAVIALKAGEIEPEFLVHLLDLIAHGEHETERARVGKIDVGGHFKGDVAGLLQYGSEFSRLRHDGDRLAARRHDFWVAARQRMEFQTAVIAPGTAIEADDERPLLEERLELDHSPGGVPHAEGWKPLADLRHETFGSALLGKTLDPLVIGRFQLRQHSPRPCQIRRQPLVQRLGGGIGALKRFSQRLLYGIRIQHEVDASWLSGRA